MRDEVTGRDPILVECDIVDPRMFGLKMTCLSLALSDVLNMIERLTAVSRGTIEQLSRQFHY